mmetsp:Transcript_114695/g.263267  ORF Transcript_114695/g.263267 Transcript_114695/m.263267 type:complete len:325 (-) Transcript_114695:102-1076(-)
MALTGLRNWWKGGGRRFDVPFVLKGHCKHWPARQKWMRPEFLVDNFGQEEILARRIAPTREIIDMGEEFVRMTVEEYLWYYTTPADERPLSNGCIVYWGPQELRGTKFEQLMEDYTPPTEILLPEDDFIHRNRSAIEAIVPEDLRFMLFYQWMYLGPAGSYTRCHVDPLGSASWTAVLSGQQKVVMMPADQEHMLPLDRRDSLEAAGVYKQYNVDFRRPLEGIARGAAKGVFAEAIRDAQIFLLDAGDVLYCPPNWPKAIINEADSLVVTENFVLDPVGDRLEERPSLRSSMDEALQSVAAARMLPDEDKAAFAKFREQLQAMT